MTETWLYHDSSTVKIETDLTTKYWPNQIVKITQATDKFFKIVSVTYSAPYTYLALDGDGIYTVADAAITAHSYSMFAAPVGMPAGMFVPDISGKVDSSTLTARGDIPFRDATGWARLVAGTANYPLVSGGAGADVTYASISTILDDLIGSTRGSILYRGETAWATRTPGTANYSLVSGGAGADVTYASISTILDALIGSTRGSILYRGETAWATRTPGTDNYVLASAGAGSDPGYESLASLITALSNDVTQADGKYIATDKIRARDGDGLSLQDDGGNGVLIRDGGGMAFPNTVGDKISLYDSRLGATNGYCLGIEPCTMYFKSFGVFRWYVNANADDGTSDRMELSGNNLWIAGDCSALTFTDRCKFPEGIDALAAIRPIKGDGKGGLDHDSLPDCVRVRASKDIFEERDVLDENGQPKRDETGQKITEQVKVGEEIEEGRDLGAMVSVLTKAVQELEAIVKAQAAEITDLKTQKLLRSS